MDNQKQTTMLTIYNTTVKVTSQEQAGRLKQICIDYGLPIWDDKDAFVLDGTIQKLEQIIIWCSNNEDKLCNIFKTKNYGKTK